MLTMHMFIPCIMHTARLLTLLLFAFIPVLFSFFSDLISKSLLTSVPLSTQDGTMSGGITDPAESGTTVSQTDNFAFTDDITKRVLLSGTVGTQEALVCE